MKLSKKIILSSMLYALLTPIAYGMDVDEPQEQPSEPTARRETSAQQESRDHLAEEQEAGYIKIEPKRPSFFSVNRAKDTFSDAFGDGKDVSGAMVKYSGDGDADIFENGADEAKFRNLRPDRQLDKTNDWLELQKRKQSTELRAAKETYDAELEDLSKIHIHIAADRTKLATNQQELQSLQTEADQTTNKNLESYKSLQRKITNLKSINEIITNNIETETKEIASKTQEFKAKHEQTRSNLAKQYTDQRNNFITRINTIFDNASHVSETYRLTYDRKTEKFVLLKKGGKPTPQSNKINSSDFQSESGAPRAAATPQPTRPSVTPPAKQTPVVTNQPETPVKQESSSAKQLTPQDQTEKLLRHFANPEENNDGPLFRPSPKSTPTPLEKQNVPTVNGNEQNPANEPEPSTPAAQSNEAQQQQPANDWSDEPLFKSTSKPTNQPEPSTPVAPLHEESDNGSPAQTPTPNNVEDEWWPSSTTGSPAEPVAKPNLYGTEGTKAASPSNGQKWSFMQD